MHDATLLYVFLHVLTYMMLRCCTSSCTSSHTWCYAAVRRLALPHIYDATLVYVVLHFLTYMMQRYCMSSCTSSHTSCNATVCRLALPHIYDGTLVYVSLAQWQDSRLAVEMGKQVPQKPLQAHCRNCEEHLAQKKRECRWGFFTYPVKSTRVLFKEIELWERCKTTVICGMKSMTNAANVENAGSINNPPGCICIYNIYTYVYIYVYVYICM